MSDPRYIYVSGPMRGIDGFNFPAFFEAEAALRERYPEADICNPAREDVVRFNLHHLLDEDPTGLSAGRWLMDEAEFGPKELREALGGDLDYICRYADLIVLLPGWENSSGATAELAAAKALGTNVMTVTVNAVPVTDDPETKWERPTGREEVRVTSATGGQKGTKLAAFDQISPTIEWELAEHFGKGARKYAAHNFRNGYPWSLSYSALRRHLSDFWAGEEFDTCPADGAGCRRDDGEDYEPGTCYNHTGSRHIIAALWHASVLAEFSRYAKFKEYDDRYVYDN